MICNLYLDEGTVKSILGMCIRSAEHTKLGVFPEGKELNCCSDSISETAVNDSSNTAPSFPRYTGIRPEGFPPTESIAKLNSDVAP